MVPFQGLFKDNNWPILEIEPHIKSSLVIQFLCQSRNQLSWVTHHLCDCYHIQFIIYFSTSKKPRNPVGSTFKIYQAHIQLRMPKLPFSCLDYCSELLTSLPRTFLTHQPKFKFLAMAYQASHDLALSRLWVASPTPSLLRPHSFCFRHTSLQLFFAHQKCSCLRVFGTFPGGSSTVVSKKQFYVYVLIYPLFFILF